MIYNARNRGNDTVESQKEKIPVLMLFPVQSVKNRRTKTTYTSQYCVCEHEEVFLTTTF